MAADLASGLMLRGRPRVFFTPCSSSPRILPDRELAGWEVNMKTPTKLKAAEEELKRLMADVTRAMDKAQDAIAKVAATTTAPASAAQPVSAVHE